jgi:cytochrome c551/c552
MTSIIKKIKHLLLICSIFAIGTIFTNATYIKETTPPTEDDYYKIIRVPIPEGIVLEVGGLATMPNGQVAVSTRRGEVWVVDNPSAPMPTFRLFATGLHEILGLAYKNGDLYCAQRGELTKLVDRNGDGKADRYENVATLPITGHYHEYSFGPKVGKDGSFYVTGNVSFGSPDWWNGKSDAPWRGWLMKISEDGKIEPIAAGLRSPCGIGMVDGEYFYGDNQGDWMGSGFVAHVEKGDFLGHPASLNWADRPESPVKIRKEMIYAKVDPRTTERKPENIKDEPLMTIYNMSKKVYPNMQIKPPAVWLPHGILGVSTSEIITDDNKGSFGPFAGQLFVGDQGMSKIARVFLEKVNGTYQGASFDFKSGFRSGVLRMSWGTDNSMFVGGTNRGWGSTGKETFGLERLVWTGKTPFEMKAVRAMPDGFEVEFTQPVNAISAQNLKNYTATSYTYKYHPVYGSPIADFKENVVRGARVSADGMKARLVIDGLREGYVHDLKLDGVVSAKENIGLLHPQAFYTLNSIPQGSKSDMALSAGATKNVVATDKGTAVNTPDNQMKEARPVTQKEVQKEAIKKVTKPKETTNPANNEKEIAALLSKWTCNACHKTNERAVGPAFSEIAKRKYSIAQIVQLVHEPKPDHWSDYTPMAPMAHVPVQDIEKIAGWINSLRK